MEDTVNTLYGIRYLLQNEEIWSKGAEAKDRYYVTIEEYLDKRDNVCHLCLYGMVRLCVATLYPHYSREEQRDLRDEVCIEIGTTIDICEKYENSETIWQKIASYNDRCVSIDQIRYVIDTTIDLYKFIGKVEKIFQE